MADLRKHISIIRVPIQRKRKKRGFGRSPERNNIEHGSRIKSRIQEIVQESEKIRTESPPVMDPVHVVRLQYDSKIDTDSLRRANISLLDEEPDKQIIVLSEDKFNELEDRISQYSQEVPEGKNPPYKSLIASMSGDIERTTSEDRTGYKLAKKQVEQDKDYRLDVELWDFGDYDKNQKRIRQFEEFIERNDGSVLDSHISNELILFRVRLRGEYINRLLNDDNIRLVDLPPAPDRKVTLDIRKSLPEFSVLTSPPDDAQSICVIDSGILTGHPLLADAVGDTEAFHSNLKSGIDEHGHGTLVAGIALYSDIQKCIDRLTFEPKIYIYGARVLNANNQFDDDQLVVTQMENSIRHFHKEYRCRIFNISIGDPDQIYADGKPSPWAQTLDLLVTELDIVIIVSAGNLRISGMRDEKADQIRNTYPLYLVSGIAEENDTRIIEPATAANVITVGALAHTDRSFMEFRYADDLIQPLAEIDMPSPFTRCGPGINGAIKPEICDYGGNLIWRSSPNDIREDMQLGIISTSMNYTKKLFSTSTGTSFAAPKVAHLAASILNQYPDASANLVRALIANSAEIPPAIESITGKEDETKFDGDDVLRICGYGRPDLRRAIYSDETRVTLLADEVIDLDSMHIYEIPIPEEFQNLNVERRVSVSLAYDPPTRRTRYDYLGIGMEMRLFRGLDVNQVINKFAEDPEGEVLDKIPDRNKCKLTPSPTRREGGTLQKGVWVAKRNSVFDSLEANGNILHLLVKCKSIWADEVQHPKQKYAVVVTIEYIDGMIDLYNLINQRVRVRKRIRI